MKSLPFAFSITLVLGASTFVRAGGPFDFEPRLDAADLYRGGGSGGLTLAADSLEAVAQAGPAPSAGLTTTLAPMALGAEGDTGTYISARLGPLWFLEDLEDFDVGFNGEIAVGNRIFSFLAVEFQSGYFWGEEDSDTELWGVPFVVNAKGILPLFFLEIYGGIGIGGYYINLDFPGGDDDDFVFGGNIFLGAGLDVGPVGVGLEGKYILTEEFDTPGPDASFEGFALMAYVTLGLGG
jgi:hypothetical protein